MGWAADALSAWELLTEVPNVSMTQDAGLGAEGIGLWVAKEAPRIAERAGSAGFQCHRLMLSERCVVAGPGVEVAEKCLSATLSMLVAEGR